MQKENGVDLSATLDECRHQFQDAGKLLAKMNPLFLTEEGLRDLSRHDIRMIIHSNGKSIKIVSPGWNRVFEEGRGDDLTWVVEL